MICVNDTLRELKLGCLLYISLLSVEGFITVHIAYATFLLLIHVHKCNCSCTMLINVLHSYCVDISQCIPDGPSSC